MSASFVTVSEATANVPNSTIEVVGGELIQVLRMLKDVIQQFLVERENTQAAVLQQGVAIAENLLARQADVNHSVLNAIAALADQKQSGSVSYEADTRCSQANIPDSSPESQTGYAHVEAEFTNEQPVQVEYGQDLYSTSAGKQADQYMYDSQGNEVPQQGKSDRLHYQPNPVKREKLTNWVVRKRRANAHKDDEPVSSRENTTYINPDHYEGWNNPGTYQADAMARNPLYGQEEQPHEPRYTNRAKEALNSSGLPMHTQVAVYTTAKEFNDYDINSSCIYIAQMFSNFVRDSKKPDGSSYFPNPDKYFSQLISVARKHVRRIPFHDQDVDRRNNRMLTFIEVLDQEVKSCLSSLGTSGNGEGVVYEQPQRARAQKLAHGHSRQRTGRRRQEHAQPAGEQASYEQPQQANSGQVRYEQPQYREEQVAYEQPRQQQAGSPRYKQPQYREEQTEYEQPRRQAVQAGYEQAEYEQSRQPQSGSSRYEYPQQTRVNQSGYQRSQQRTEQPVYEQPQYREEQVAYEQPRHQAMQAGYEQPRRQTVQAGYERSQSRVDNESYQHLKQKEADLIEELESLRRGMYPDVTPERMVAELARSGKRFTKTELDELLDETASEELFDEAMEIVCTLWIQDVNKELDEVRAAMIA